MDNANTANAKKKTDEIKQAFLSSAISDISAYIQLADTKVSIIMAAAVALIVGLFACYEPIGKLIASVKPCSWQGVALLVLAALLAVSTISVFVFGILTIRSHVSKISYKSKWFLPQSTKEYSFDAYKADVLAKQYYLQLDDDIAPCVAKEYKPVLSLVDELKMEYQKQLADLTKKSEELGKKEQLLSEKESQLNRTTVETNKKAKELIAKEKSLNVQTYRFYLDVLGSGHCKTAYVTEMGQDFWEENLDELILAGAQIGKDEHAVKQEISYAMVDIYQSLKKYDKAYDFLVEQAAGHPWLHLFTVQDIVTKVGYCERLKTALYQRLGKDDLSTKQREDFTKIKDWLVFEYKQ